MDITWTDDRGFSLDEAVAQRARTGLKAVADWATRNQVRHVWPRWDANSGRFPYHVHLNTDDVFYSTSWNTARMVQGMLSAWLVLRDPEYLATAERGLEYVKSLQFFGPELSDLNGFFFAETPLSDHFPGRDGIECTQALIAHHLVTRDPVSLMRARAFCDKFVERMGNGRWPNEELNIVPRLKSNQFLAKMWTGLAEKDQWCSFAAAIPLLQLASVTGDDRYVAAACRLGNCILKHICFPDGSMRALNSGHHTSTPDGLLDNDDGLVLALMALWKHTKQQKYLDAAVANADWWINGNGSLSTNYTTYSLLTMNMADIARVTRKPQYTDFIRAHVEQFFARQILRDTRPLVSGAFSGEDMAKHYRAGSSVGDFISLRSTSYGALALGRLACTSASDWNPSYSAFGW